jgi:hypothetical protein
MVSQNRILIFIFLVLLAPVILLALVYRSSPNVVRRSEELRRMAAETSLYPDFKEIDSRTLVKEHSVAIRFYYNVPAYSTTFNMVKNYYTLALTPNGWRLDKEDTFGGDEGVIFRKDKYSISIYISEGRASGWDYSITYGWRE